MKPLRSRDVASRRIGGKVFIVAPGEGRLTMLSEVAGRIWDLSDGTRTAAEIAAELTREFEVAPETAAADTEAFLGVLAQKGLVQ